MSNARILRRGAAVALISVAALASCKDALTVENPSLIPETGLQTSDLINVLTNSAVAAIQNNYDGLVFFSGILTDEALNATNDYRSGELSQRIVELGQGDVGPYQSLATMRAVTDSVASRIAALVSSPSSDLRLARAYAMAGYGYLFYGEFLCTAPINGGPLLSDDSLWQIGLSRFKQAISIATAADNGSTKVVADSILNLARVGAGRISLDLNNPTAASGYAALVDPNFVWNVQYITSTVGFLENSVWGQDVGANLQFGVHPLMQNLNDPRVAYNSKCALGHNQVTLICVPYSPRSWSTYNYTTPAIMQPYSNIELASGLEAQYIVAEAAGPTASTAAFVAARQAYGHETVTSPTGDALMAALREERRRDFFMRATRLGDLRRYKATGIGDFFPSGPDPTTQWGLYGSATCYIIDQNEVNSNPNAAGYVPPATRPPGYSP
jgi:hypothetical protein